MQGNSRGAHHAANRSLTEAIATRHIGLCLARAQTIRRSQAAMVLFAKLDQGGRDDQVDFDYRICSRRNAMGGGHDRRQKVVLHFLTIVEFERGRLRAVFLLGPVQD